VKRAAPLLVGLLALALIVMIMFYSGMFMRGD
jgi:hypothetical protein